MNHVLVSRNAAGIAGLLLAPALWVATVDLAGAQLHGIPPLSDVLSELASRSASGELALELGATLRRSSLAMALALPLGMLVGFFLASNSVMARVASQPLEFLRAIPVSALVPLFLLLFGVDEEGKIAMIFLPTFLLQSAATASGLRQVSPARCEMAAAFGASALERFLRITLFEAAPGTVAGLRLAVPLALVVAVVTEMFIGSNHGVGMRMYECYLANAPSTLFAYLLLLGAVGWFLGAFLDNLERRVSRWRSH